MFHIALTMSLVCAAGCSNKTANHVPPIWQWPTAAIGTAIDNGIYGVRRQKVKYYLTLHYHALRKNMLMEVAPADLSVEFVNGCQVAKVYPHSCRLLHDQLRQDKRLYFLLGEDLSLEQAIENLTVAFMVHRH